MSPNLLVKSIIPVLISCSVLFVAGCLVPPSRWLKTPAVSGRVIDKTTQAPLANVKIEFIQPDPKSMVLAVKLPAAPFGPSTVTARDGRFEMERTYHYVAGGVITNPMAGDKMILGSTSFSPFLRLECPEFETKIIDAGDALSKGDQLNGVINYPGTVQLGDIPLTKKKAPQSTNIAPNSVDVPKSK